MERGDDWGVTRMLAPLIILLGRVKECILG